MIRFVRNPMTSEHIWDEMKRYVGFGAADEALLRAIGPQVKPHHQRIADHFYERMRDFPLALSVFTGPGQIERLKGTMQRWLDVLFEGPWDIGYFELRARIGRRHVLINLSQHYMFTAMQVIRQDLTEIIFEQAPDLEWARRHVIALDKVIDLELAVMLHTYRQDYLQQMQRAERLSTLGQLAGAIGHELRNPLGVIESSAYLLHRKAGADETIARHSRKITDQVELANRIITNLLDLVRGRKPDCVAVDASSVAQHAAAQVGELAKRPIELRVDVMPLYASIDVDHTRQILVNLLTNAVQSSGEQGTVRLSVGADGNDVRFLVEDDGPGIDPEIASRLFEPLVTTRLQGVGLGLALCRKLAEAQGGTVRLTTGSLKGAAFELRLARASQPVA